MVVKTVYGASADEVADLFEGYLEGDASRPAMALGAGLPDSTVRNAIEKSLAAFGYDEPACTYVMLEANDTPLDPQAIFLLIEGLDPLYVIVVDKAAAEKVARAFHAAFDLDAPARLNGRPAAVFENLAALLQTPSGKQVAWKTLKTLAK